MVGMLPVALGAIGGRWDLPTNGAEQPLAFLNRPAPGGAARVLWLGDPRALPVGGWAVEPGLAYGLTDTRLPDSSLVWTPAGPGPADTVHAAVQLAISGGTVHLGRLLAAAGVRYIVLVDGLTPAANSFPTSVEAPAPSGLARRAAQPERLAGGAGRIRPERLCEREAMPTSGNGRPPLATGPTWTFPAAGDVLGWRPRCAVWRTRVRPAPFRAPISMPATPRPATQPVVAGRAVARSPPSDGRRSSPPPRPGGPRSAWTVGRSFRSPSCSRCSAG